MIVRLVPLLLVLVTGGCAYDPYTGTYVPCCAYPAYPYGYAAPGYATAGPQPAPLAAPGRVEPPPPQAAAPARLERRFKQANVTQDGRLTREQAQAAGWKVVARNFDAIDVDRKGFVTPGDIQAWMNAHR